LIPCVMKKLLLFSVLLSGSCSLYAQSRDPKATEVWSPVPASVTTTQAYSAAPSDAIVLFKGGTLSEWQSVKDGSEAKWTVQGDHFTVNKGTGNIETKRKFSDYQLHIEWKIPANISGKDQGRGNSGIFLASIGKGDEGYELQILDSYNNQTYSNGQAGS